MKADELFFPVLYSSFDKTRIFSLRLEEIIFDFIEVFNARKILQSLKLDIIEPIIFKILIRNLLTLVC